MNENTTDTTNITNEASSTIQVVEDPKNEKTSIEVNETEKKTLKKFFSNLFGELKQESKQESKETSKKNNENNDDENIVSNNETVTLTKSELAELIKEQTQEGINNVAKKTRQKEQEKSNLEKVLENVAPEFKDFVTYQYKNTKDFNVEEFLSTNSQYKKKISTNVPSYTGNIKKEKTGYDDFYMRNFKK